MSLFDILKQTAPDNFINIVLAKVNNRVRSLQEELSEDATIEWISIDTLEGRRSYQQTLCLVLVRAFEELFPNKHLIIDHSLGKGLYCELKKGAFTESMLEALKRQILEIIRNDDPILPVDKSCNGETLKRPATPRSLRTLYPYRCGNTVTCMGYPLLPSAGWLKTFDLKLWTPGMILRLPDEDDINILPPYQEQNKLFEVFHEYGQWMEILGVEYPDDLNRAIEIGEISELIKIAEGLHEKKIASIADQITKQRADARVVLIAGPSSSGKTSFIKRLTIQLRVNGLRPLTVSLDDYFLDRDKTPVDKDGNPDWESIHALNVPRFNQDLKDLLDGEFVRLPVFDFVQGKSNPGPEVQLQNDQPVLIEGLHGLNDELTPEIPASCKFKIYVSALTQLNLTPYLRVPTSDVRLLRRLVRGYKFRGHSAEDTLSMWRLVRLGEEKYIFPFQESANVIFNSSIIYEPNVFRDLAAPLLEAVSEDNPCFPEAERILRLLYAFEPIVWDQVPRNSILREFIGGSSFNY